MQVTDKLMMVSMAVKDMPAMKTFYADKLGLEVTQDYRQDDENWWVTLTFPGGGTTITMSTFKSAQQPGTMNMYFTTSDIEAARKNLSENDVTVSDVQDDLYGPGSGVKFVNVDDPEGNKLLLVQE